MYTDANRNKSLESKSIQIEEIFHKFSKRVFNIAYRFTNNYTDAQDLAQEAFVKLITAIRNGKCNTNLPMESYLYKIIKNSYIDGMRKKPKIQIVSIDEMLPYTEKERLEFIQGSLPEPEIPIEKKILEDNIQRALKRIPFEFRMPVILADIEGFSYKEISKILNSRIGTIRSRIHRGRKILAKILSPILGYKK
jgi:RNA polymerase sigma-70 factor (ECF subfamily)